MSRNFRAFQQLDRERAERMEHDNVRLRAMLLKIYERADRLGFHERATLGVDEIPVALGIVSEPGRGNG